MASATGDPLKDLDVLILDDAATVRSKVRSVLEELSIPSDKIREAETAREGLDAVEQAPPDLLLLDLVLPDIPGEEVGSVLLDKLPDTQIVPLTALDTNDRRVRRLISNGAFDVLQKPIRRHAVEELFATLRREDPTPP